MKEKNNLLDLGNVAGDVFYCRRVFHSQTIALALEACFVNQNSGIGDESSESQADVAIKLHDLSHSPLVLQLGGRLLFYAEHHGLLTFDSNRGGSILHSLHRVLDLEEMPIGGEYGYSPIVRHGILYYYSVLGIVVLGWAVCARRSR